MQSHAQDELLKIYRREYKHRFAWIRAGKNLEGLRLCSDYIGNIR